MNRRMTVSVIREALRRWVGAEGLGVKRCEIIAWLFRFCQGVALFGRVVRGWPGLRPAMTVRAVRRFSIEQRTDRTFVADAAHGLGQQGGDGQRFQLGHRLVEAFKRGL